MTTDDSKLSMDPEELTFTYQADWNTFGRHLAVVVLLVAAVFAASLIRPVLQFVILAAILIFVLAFPVQLVERRLGLSHGLAAGLVFILYLLVAVALFLFLTIPV